MDKYVVNSKVNMDSDSNTFSIITCVDGSGLINYKGGTEVVNKDDSLLTPVQLCNYEIKGDLEVLISNPTINEK